MTDITTALDKIIQLPPHNQEASLYALQPGLSSNEITRITEPILPLQLTTEAYELYMWRNGVRPGSAFKDSQVFLHYEFLSLEEALTITQMIWEIGERSHMYLMEWEHQPLFIIFENNGEYLATPLSEKKFDVSPIVLISKIGEVCGLQFLSLTRMIQTILEACESGAFYMDNEGWISINENKWQALHEKLNPGIATLYSF